MFFFFEESDINLAHLCRIQIHRFDAIIITPTTMSHEEWLRTDYIIVFLQCENAERFSYRKQPHRRQ